jgi:hypothetical protein
MSRTPILIGAAFAFALSASAASALPFAPQRAAPAPEAGQLQLVEPVHYRKVRKFRRHHPYAYSYRHRPGLSFSLQFGAPVVRHYPYYQYYPYPHYRYTYPSYYYEPRYYRRSGVYFGW